MPDSLIQKNRKLKETESLLKKESGDCKMKKFNIYLITLVILVTVVGSANADWNWGIFTKGIDGWFVNYGGPAGSGVPGGVQQGSYDGVSVLWWVSTCANVMADTGQTIIAAAGPFGNMSLNGETTMQFEIAFSGNISTVQWTPFVASHNSSPSSNYYWGYGEGYLSPTDGNFSTFTYALGTIEFSAITTVVGTDTTIVSGLIYDTTSCMIQYGFNMYNNPPGSIFTTYLAYWKSYGDWVVYPPTTYADFLNSFDISGWAANWNEYAILGNNDAQNQRGLHLNTASPGTLGWVDLDTAAISVHTGGAGSNIGASVSGTWNNTLQNVGTLGSFIEVRLSADTSYYGANSTTPGIWDGRASISGVIFKNSAHFNSQTMLPAIPLDGEFHTYSWSLATCTTAVVNGNTTTAGTPDGYNQIGVNLNGHGMTDVQVLIDYVKFESTGSPLIYTDSGLVGVYNDPTQNIGVKPSASKEFFVVNGAAPFIWSITSVSGAASSLSAYSGTTIDFIASANGGVSQITVVDANGRSIATPIITVTGTSAPLAVDADVTDTSHVQFDLFKE